jgi:uncharacterized protein (DUF433 family)
MIVANNKLIDIYKGKSPADIPVYTISEAAHYLRLPVATIRSWAVGRQYPTQSGSGDFRPLIDIADPDGRLLSFRNLGELHVLGSIRRAHQVKMPAVRQAIDYLRQQFRSDHPLLEKKMLTDGKDLFIEQYENLVTITRHGQMAMKLIMAVYLRRIEWDNAGMPVRLFPFTRDRYEESPEIVSIDPRIRFGKPCINGTRIPTSIIAERHQAGDSIDFLAKDYGRTAEEIEEAIRYEGRIAA